MKIGVIIPAAGKSTRFGDTDKLSQDLGGRPLLIRTIEAFGKREEFGPIVVAGPADPGDFDSFKQRFGPTLGFHGASILKGGKIERWETVKNALDAVPKECTHIAVHDAARPVVNPKMLGRLIDAAGIYPAVIPAITITNTVKRVTGAPQETAAEEDDIADSILGDEGKPMVVTQDVIETIDRTNLVMVQTPQIFESELLRKAYAQKDLSGATDDAMLVERLGEKVRIVTGDIRNIKVTTKDDLALVRSILGVSAPSGRPAHLRF